MKRRRPVSYKIWLSIFGLLGILSPGFSQSSLTLEGVIETHITDEDGTPVNVAFSVEEIDEEGDTVNRHFIIENNNKGKELLTHVGETVQIKGTVRKDKEGNDVLTVWEYTSLADESDDEEKDSENYE
ncbi:hypothetical protein ACFL5V_06020 [Fibrobacterota bacterium]